MYIVNSQAQGKYKVKILENIIYIQFNRNKNATTNINYKNIKNIIKIKNKNKNKKINLKGEMFIRRHLDDPG